MYDGRVRDTALVFRLVAGSRQLALASDWTMAKAANLRLGQREPAAHAEAPSTLSIGEKQGDTGQGVIGEHGEILIHLHPVYT